MAWQSLDLGIAGVHAGYTTRQAGVSRAPFGAGPGVDGGMNLALHVGDEVGAVLANRQLLQQTIGGAQGCTPLWLNQVHGTRVIDAAQLIHAPSSIPADADASICMQAGIACCVMTADCLPVLFWDIAGRAGRVVGAAHAGWRGLAAGVLHNTVAAMREQGAQEISAWLGPAIGPQHFEVGDDVRAAFASQFSPAIIAASFVAKPGAPGKYLADIFALARAALQQVGVQKIFGGGMCTVSDSAQFYSYRRDQQTGRMAALIWLE